MTKSGAAQVRAAAFVRRGVWQLQRGQCRGPAAALLLLAVGFLLAAGLLVTGGSALSGLSLRGAFGSNPSAEVNALRWGRKGDVVILDGRRLEQPLPESYPNGAVNTFQCDLPSLRFQCDLDSREGCRGYPQLFPASALFENWSPEHTARRPNAVFDSVCHFNVSSLVSQMFREMEVPFVAYGVPELSTATERWTDTYLTEQLDPTALYKVHVANSSHFMYYRKSKQLSGETNTYESRWMTYPQFVQAVGDATSLQDAGLPHEYYYFMLKKHDLVGQAGFVYEDLRFLNPLQSERDPRFGDLFIRDAAVAEDGGMRCRLGMQGIIAEGHIDGGLNMVSMIRGTKRYVLSPPSVCKCLALLTAGQSSRHTALNWSDTSALSESARECPATEVALTAGEVLYLPSYWYHHIVSLDTSIQCNLRSGLAIRDDARQFLRECGFKM
ncbi:hypothetical protein BBJ28_00003819 [Nothophytophthora sp. Chile5]|nr:hypothetical protein BBJ28_00003819 [Nothophytophthora sp. Chile5]